MKQSTKYLSLFLLSFFVMAGSVFAQQSRELQYFTNPDQTGLNQFEAPFTTDVDFDGVQVRIGGSNALQFQGLSQDNDFSDPDSPNYLPDLESNFNLATSNLDLDVALERGLRMHLRTYLTSQHHNETYVKSGYMQVDRLDFISEGLASDLMDHLRIKVGHMELNYGDNHFRRSDNAAAIHNPFVGNYIMDSFTTEVAGEIYYYDSGFMAMFGLSNGKLNQSVTDKSVDRDGNIILDGTKTHASIYGKLAYDKTFDDGLRFRLSGSILNAPHTPSYRLYAGDRAGSRYYDVIVPGDFRAGRINPDFGRGVLEVTSIMINPFVKFGGLEFYGVYENASGKVKTASDNNSYNQYGAELLYRFGASEDVYLGARYNYVDGESQDGDIEVDRFNIGGGWFLTKNVLAKLEYVTQNYDGPAYDDTPYQGASFNGVMLEAIISF